MQPTMTAIDLQKGNVIKYGDWTAQIVNPPQLVPCVFEGGEDSLRIEVERLNGDRLTLRYPLLKPVPVDLA